MTEPTPDIELPPVTEPQQPQLELDDEALLILVLAMRDGEVEIS